VQEQLKNIENILKAE
jgi:hypothetical protein